MISAFSLYARVQKTKQKPAKDRRHTSTSHLPRCDDGDVSRALRTAPRADILEVCLKISFGEPGLSKAHRLFLSRASAKEKKKEKTDTTPIPCSRNHTHLCVRPRADLRRGLHHLDLMRALHAPQRPNERRERPPFPGRDDVEIRRRR